MPKDKSDELMRVRRDYFELEEKSQEEKEILCKVINTFATIASMQPGFTEEIRIVRSVINPDAELPLDQIDQGVRALKNKIIAREENTGTPGDTTDVTGLRDLEEKTFEACRVIRRIMSVILEDFYPMTSVMEAAAREIRIDCIEDPSQIEFKQPTEDLLRFIEGLKIKISQDFKYINQTFLAFLKQVKELEQSLSGEFDGAKALKEIEYFEMKVTNEMGSITESFNLYTRISEIKQVVSEKLSNIRRLVSSKKKSEVEKSLHANEYIKTLKRRISKVERHIQVMSKKAERLQEVAMKDGLTGLYNRKAFDMKIKESIDNLSVNSNPFSVIIFDVDKFKNINDTFGHVAGDKVLRKVAQCLVETFRKDDFIARFGGDEFVVAIEGLTMEMARDRIVNFKNNLGKKRFVSYKSGEIDITVSSGISIGVTGDTPESLIARADEAMYQQKQHAA